METPYNVITRNECVITGSKNLEELYTFKRFPVHQNTTYEPYECDILLDLVFDICRDSGMIQVRNLVPESILYNAAHSRSIGRTWQEHHKAFAEFIRKYKPKHVFEIGGGCGYLEMAYNAPEAISSAEWTILEPNPDPADGTQANYEIGFFDENYMPNSEYDVLVFSHLFEHIYKPASFMKHIADVFPRDGSHLLFSVPDMQCMLKNRQSNTLNFEHNFYLAEPYVDYLLKNNGFSVIEKQHYRGHSIFYATEKVPNTEAINTAPLVGGGTI